MEGEKKESFTLEAEGEFSEEVKRERELAKIRSLFLHPAFEIQLKVQVQVEIAKYNQSGHAGTSACQRLLHDGGDEGEGFLQEGEEEEEQGWGEEVQDAEGRRSAGDDK